MAAARTIAARLVATFGTPLSEPLRTGDAELTHVFPAAHELRHADFTKIGVPTRRAAALRTTARSTGPEPMPTATRARFFPGEDRGRLGAFQRSLLETNKNALNDTLVNLSDAESQIRDAEK